MANVKINQSDLKREIIAQDTKNSGKRFFNINALRLMLDAAKDVTDSKSFTDAFTPTRENNAIARKLKLGLDVERGRWIVKEQTMPQVNEAVEGSKLIELLLQALSEGDTIRFAELTNQLLSYKVSECLADRRKLIAEQLFSGRLKEIHDLVKTSNLDRDEGDNPPEEDELLPNADLADPPSEFEEGSESDRLDTFWRSNRG